MQAAQPASTYSSGPLTGDADSGVSTTKTYTHALNFNGPDVTVNGVVFEAAGQSGSNYTLVSYDPVTGDTGGALSFGGYSNNLTGGMNALMQDFYYTSGRGSRLTLTGLTPGTTYTATFYGAAFGSGPRIQTISDSQTGMIVGFDEDQYGLSNGQGNGIMLKATYTATGTSVTFTFVPSDPNVSFHQYAMSNEVATTAAPTAAWGRSAVSGNGSNGLATGAYALPATTGGFYVRPVAAPGATLPASSLFAFVPVGMGETMPASFGGLSVAAITADLPRNGSTNLVVLSGTTIQVRLVKADGTAYFQQYDTGLAALTSGTPDLAAVDVNGDGILDLVAAGNGGFSVLLGIGGGEFATARTFQTSQFASQDVVATTAPGGAVFAGTRGGTTIIPLEWDSGTATLVAGPTITSVSPVQQLASGDIDGQGGFDLVVYDGTAVHVMSGANYTTDSVVASFTGAAAPGRLVVASLRGNAGQSILLARQVAGAATLTLVQVGSGGNYVQQTAPLGAVDPTAPLWVGVGDFADDNNGLLDVVAGAGTKAWLFVNDGTAAAPLVFAPSAAITVAAASARAFVPFTFTPHAPTDLVSIDAAGNLVGWHNLIHSVFVNGSVAMPAGQDLAVRLPGAGGGSITGTVWYDPTNSGTWSSDDAGWSDGVTVYLDLNNNGQPDAGEPTESPSLSGQYTFKQVKPGTYVVRMILGTGGITTTMSQSWPASNTGVTVSVPGGPGTAVYGVDFGVYVDENSVDLNADGHPDVLLTDPSDGGVYVQLHRGTTRLGAVRLGALPGDTWSVVGAGDYSADGGPDILLYDAATGALRVWQIASGGAAPRVIREFDLRYRVPAGFAVVGFGDPDRQGKAILVLRNDATGEHRTVTFSIRGTSPVDTATESVMPLPSYLRVVGVGDLDGDGLNDMLVRDSRNGHLTARLYRGAGSEPVTVDLGRPDPNWAVAGVLNLHGGPGADDILFQDRATGKAYVWTLATGSQTPSVREVDVGTHDGLRIHFAESAPVAPPVPPRDTLSRILAVGGVDGTVFHPVTTPTKSRPARHKSAPPFVLDAV